MASRKLPLPRRHVALIIAPALRKKCRAEPEIRPATADQIGDNFVGAASRQARSRFSAACTSVYWTGLSPDCTRRARNSVIAQQPHVASHSLRWQSTPNLTNRTSNPVL